MAKIKIRANYLLRNVQQIKIRTHNKSLKECYFLLCFIVLSAVLFGGGWGQTRPVTEVTTCEGPVCEPLLGMWAAD